MWVTLGWISQGLQMRVWSFLNEFHVPLPPKMAATAPVKVGENATGVSLGKKKFLLIKKWTFMGYFGVEKRARHWTFRWAPQKGGYRLKKRHFVEKNWQILKNAKTLFAHNLKTKRKFKLLAILLRRIHENQRWMTLVSFESVQPFSQEVFFCPLV